MLLPGSVRNKYSLHSISWIAFNAILLSASFFAHSPFQGTPSLRFKQVWAGINTRKYPGLGGVAEAGVEWHGSVDQTCQEHRMQEGAFSV